MSGHSKWSTIKHKKGALDAKRGKLFSKLARAIITAARSGGGDPTMNLNLRYALDKARAANMTKDTIERAVKKGTGDLGGASYEAVVYEGYAPGGVALMVEVLTDNRNRSATDVRTVIEKRGGSLGSTNCVGWMFSTKGVFMIDSSTVTEDKLMEVVLEAGADDLETEGESFHITCDQSAFEDVKKAIGDAEIPTQLAEIQRVPSQSVKVDRSKAKQVLDLIGMLEDNEDVQNVYSNFDIDDDVMEELLASS